MVYNFKLNLLLHFCNQLLRIDGRIMLTIPSQGYLYIRHPPPAAASSAVYFLLSSSIALLFYVRPVHSRFKRPSLASEYRNDACQMVFAMILSQSYGCRPFEMNLFYFPFYNRNQIKILFLYWNYFIFKIIEIKSNISALHCCIGLLQVVCAVSAPFTHTQAWHCHDAVARFLSVVHDPCSIQTLLRQPFLSQPQAAFAFTIASKRPPLMQHPLYESRPAYSNLAFRHSLSTQ